MKNFSSPDTPRSTNRALQDADKNWPLGHPDFRAQGTPGFSPGGLHILLLQCPPWDFCLPPLGVAYLSGYLRARHYDIGVFDLNIALYNLASEDQKCLWEQKNADHWVREDLFQQTWGHLAENTEKCLKNILEERYSSSIGLSVNFSGIRFAGEVLKIISRLAPHARIIVGGWGCVTGHMRGLFPKDLVDVFVIGEGEETLEEVLKIFREDKEGKGVRGAIFTGSEDVAWVPRSPIRDLDTIPWPTFEEFDLKQYKCSALPLMTSRGCIGRCAFCNDWPLSSPYRSHSADNIFKSIQYHVEHNQRDVFSFKDLLCNGDIKQLCRLCDLIIHSGLKVHWNSQAIARSEMSPEVLRKLRDSGCDTLIYGIESFSNNVLRRMRKTFTKEIAEKVIRETCEAGIRVMINIIVGFPHETEEDFEETLDGIARNRAYIAQVAAVSVCLVNNDAELDLYPQRYGVIMPEDMEIRAKKWVSVDGHNTYEVRRQRAKKVIELLCELGLSYDTQTI